MKTAPKSGCAYLYPWARLSTVGKCIMKGHLFITSYFPNIVPKTQENYLQIHPGLRSEKKTFESIGISLFSLNELEAMTCVNPNKPVIR